MVHSLEVTRENIHIDVKTRQIVEKKKVHKQHDVANDRGKNEERKKTTVGSKAVAHARKKKKFVTAVKH